MNGLQLESTSLTPEVAFRPASNQLVMRGECYPENPAPFFGPILSALEQHLSGPSAKLHVMCRLTYVNSASARSLRRLFALLEAAGTSGSEVRVTWEYEPEDEVMQELGRDLASGLQAIDFEEQTHLAGLD